MSLNLSLNYENKVYTYVDQFKSDCLPPLLTPPGLSAAQAQYLYDEVREFVYPSLGMSCAPLQLRTSLDKCYCVNCKPTL